MVIYCFLVETWNHKRLRVTRFFERACLVRRPPFVRSAISCLEVALGFGPGPPRSRLRVFWPLLTAVDVTFPFGAATIEAFAALLFAIFLAAASAALIFAFSLAAASTAASALTFTLAVFATALVEDGITLLGALEGALETGGGGGKVDGGGGGGKVDGGGGLTAASAITVTIFVSFVDLFLTVTS